MATTTVARFGQCEESRGGRPAPLKSSMGGTLAKWGLLVCVGFALAILSQAQLDAGRIESDSGPIEAVDGDRIYVKGNRGVHVLETIGVCHWCEVGLTVLVTFKSLTRATIKPYVNTMGRRPVPVFIIHDGRED